MNTRNWPIRSKIIALVAVPLAALLAMWIFATSLTVGPALNLLAAQSLLENVGQPGDALVAELQQERREALVFLAGRGDVAALRDQRLRTDEAIAEFHRRASSAEVRDRGGDPLNSRLDQLLTALDILPSGRGFIDRREMDKSGALGLYSSVIESAFRTFSAMHALPDESLNREARAITALGRAREVHGQADALLAGVLAAGRFAEGEHAQLVQIIGTQRFLYASAVADLSEADRGTYQRLTEGDDFVRLREMEEALVSKGRTGAAPPLTAEVWQSNHDSVQRQLRAFESSAADRLAERTRPVAIGVLVRLGVAGVLGLLAVVVSLVIALRVGRSLIRRLTGLRAAALEMADERLPAIVGRLRRGGEIDVAAETPPLEYGADEIGQVGHAFGEVQRTAVRSAVDEATLRRGLSDVFLNIARRSQTLLHRQLAVLDRMERRAIDPEELEDLFRIDHMATRMRRHAEDLVILAGATPGRGWRNPVPMIDVIRGAVSEVEDYARVDIQTIQPGAIVGRAVGDVIHLLAELIENAASFSPPHTQVNVTGQVVANGYAIEIEDRGLGMTPDAIEDANLRLANPPDFDPANSARLGLFVVAQLGARHGVQVQLRPSPYGGVTAVALVPGELVVTGAGVSALPARVGAAGSAQPVPLPAADDIGAPLDVGSVGAVLLPAEPPEHPPALPEQPVRATHRLTAVPAQRAAAGPPLERALPPSRRASHAAPDPAANQSAAVRSETVELPVGADGLPRRVRQSSLPPQLRESGLRGGSHAMAGEEAPARSPEEVRAVMSALQAGTARGRQAAADTAGPVVTPPADGNSSGAGRPRSRRRGGAAPATSDLSPASGRESTESGRDV